MAFDFVVPPLEGFWWQEGLCVQCMHIGPYDDEPVTVEKMHAFMEQQGYVLDINEQRLHYEIYLSDARRVAPEKLKPVIDKNRFERKEYIEAIREALKKWNVIIPTYEELKASAPESVHVGRMQISEYMVRAGYARDVDDAMDTYIGTLGERRAYVPSIKYTNYLPLEDAVKAVIAAGGVPVLAHLFSYHLDNNSDIRKLVSDFKKAAGSHPAGMEVYYRAYSGEQRAELKEIADQNDLYYSVASDYHGRNRRGLMDQLTITDAEADRAVWKLLNMERV